MSCCKCKTNGIGPASGLTKRTGWKLSLIHIYANEQEQLIREIETLEATIATYENRQQSSERFIALLDKYERFDPCLLYTSRCV